MKKLLLFSLAVVLIISALLLVGCSKEPEKEPAAECSHSYEKTVKNPTCTKAGEEKFSCTKCDYYYTTKIEAIGIGVHNVQNGVCTVCGGKESTPGLEYSQNDDGTYKVTGIGTCTETDIVIGIHNNRDVTAIGYEAFYGCKWLTSIVISKGVTTIGNYAFYNCTSLTSIDLPDSLTTIGDVVFYKCTSLTSIELPDSLTTIGVSAFSYCTSLTSITVAEGNENYKSIDGNLYSKDGKTLIRYAIGKTDTTFTVPEGVTTIGEHAFYKCTSLTSIELPDSLTTIGYEAFCKCTSLASIELPDSLTTIGGFAFAECTSLTNIELPDSLTIIGKKAFYWCTSLTSIELPDNLTTIGVSAFYKCTSLTSIVIPEGVTTIGSDAFYGCESLTIYCEVAEKPSGWSNSWNSSGRPVVWGYTGE